MFGFWTFTLCIFFSKVASCSFEMSVGCVWIVAHSDFQRRLICIDSVRFGFNDQKSTNYLNSVPFGFERNSDVQNSDGRNPDIYCMYVCNFILAHSGFLPGLRLASKPEKKKLKVTGFSSELKPVKSRMILWERIGTPGEIFQLFV